MSTSKKGTSGEHHRSHSSSSNPPTNTNQTRISERLMTERKKDQNNRELEPLVDQQTLELKNAIESLSVAEEELRVQNEELESTNQLLTQEETQLRQANELLEIVFSSVDIMIAYMDQEFNFLHVNRAYAQADGHEPEYYLGKNHFSLFPNPENQAIFQQVVDTGQPFEVFEKPFQYEYSPDRGTSYWDWSLQPVKNREGEVKGLVLSLVDVTQRVLSDQKYHKSLERGTILAEFSHAIAQVGPDQKAVLDTITEVASKLLGGSCAIRLLSSDGKRLEVAAFADHDPEEMARLHREVTSFHQSVKEGIAGRVFRTNRGVVVTEQDFSQMRGARFAAYIRYLKKLNVNSIVAVPLHTQGSVIGVLIAYRYHPDQPYTSEDLDLLHLLADRAASAIKNANLYHELQVSLRHEQAMRIQLVQSEKYAALSRLVASVAHELNNPLQTIQNCMYLIRDHLKEGTSAPTLVEMASSEAERMANLILQLRETYRPARDNQAQSFSLDELLQSYILLLRPHLQQNHVQLQFQSDLDGCQVNGIPDQIKQVFINIGLNAIEALQPQGGILSISAGRLDSSEQIRIAFHDNGPGIPEDSLAHIFEPFFTTKTNGTGLGLAICYEIINAHGGTIQVDSQPDRGATFTIQLPLAELDLVAAE